MHIDKYVKMLCSCLATANENHCLTMVHSRVYSLRVQVYLSSGKKCLLLVNYQQIVMQMRHKGQDRFAKGDSTKKVLNNNVKCGFRFSTSNKPQSKDNIA